MQYQQTIDSRDLRELFSPRIPTLTCQMQIQENHRFKVKLHVFYHPNQQVQVQTV